MELDFLIKVITIIIPAIFVATLYRMYVKNKCELDMTNANIVALDRQFVNNADIVVLQLLDLFIDDCFQNIITLNIEYAKLSHIRKVDMDDILEKLSSIVSLRISPSLVNKISTIYNKECMSDVIAERCYLKVLDWARDINAQKFKKEDDDEDKKYTNLNFDDEDE